MISFIIPTLNEEKVLEKTLKSLARYSGKKEIIISDGRSADKTIAIAKRYANKIVIYKGKKRQTISDGRNLGAASAKGDFLVFFDADGFIENPDAFFRKALSLFQQDAKLVGITVNIRVFPKMETIGDSIVFKCLNFLHLFYNNIIHWGAAPGEFQMVRSEVFRKLGGFDVKIAAGEDYEFFRRLSKVGETRFEKSLTLYHTGRRAHKIGWPKLLSIWMLNFFSVLFSSKSASKEWKEIR